MDIRNCRNCGNIFNYAVGLVICPACKESLEAKFQEVKLYIEEHPGTTINDVAEDCNVDVQQVRQWLRDERLEVTSELNMFLSCDSCGTAIRSGRYCDKCKYDIMMGLKEAVKKPQSDEGPDNGSKKPKSAKMRFLS